MKRSPRYFIDQTRRIVKGYLFGDEAQRAAAEWFRDRGDETLRFDYPLDSKSIVVDCGGYEGEWAQAIHDRFACKVHVFEPVPEFAADIKRRFSGNGDVQIHEIGLQGRDETVNLHMDANASSAYGAAHVVIPVQMRDAVSAFDELKISCISLIKINIEGGEYDLLDRLISSGGMANVDHVQVQFHDFVPNARERRESIRAGLRATHSLKWEYPFVWESWSRTP